MRLTLMSLSSQYIHMPLSPFCLKKAVEEALPEVKITVPDLNINDPQEEILRAVMKTKPEVLALSVYIWNRAATARLCRSVKAADPAVILVLGGPEVTWSVEETFREMPCDYILRGAGEASLPALMKIVRERFGKEETPEPKGVQNANPEEASCAIPEECQDMIPKGFQAGISEETPHSIPKGHQDAAPKGFQGAIGKPPEFFPESLIPGCCFRTAEGLFISDPAEAPAPRDDIYDKDWSAFRAGRMIYAETSRGCPFHCAFCLSGRKEKVRFMEKERALALLIRLGQEDTDTVKLIDRTFNCDRERTRYLISGLTDARNRGEIGPVCYHLEVAADLFDEETLTLLAAAPAGLFQMEAGLQSFNSETLTACHRTTDMALLKKNVARILETGNIHLHIDLIAGLPGEDLESFGDSFNQAMALKPHQLQLGFLKLIHGSDLRARDWGQRFSPDPPYEVLSTPWISFEELSRLHPCADAVERIWNSRRFFHTLELAFRTAGRTPFELFMILGSRMDAEPGKRSLDRLTKMILETLTALGVPEDELTDALRTDRMETDNTGFLPEFLRLDRPELKKITANWRAEHPDRYRPRFALLSDGRVLAAWWKEKDPVTGRCPPSETEILA